MICPITWANARRTEWMSWTGITDNSETRLENGISRTWTWPPTSIRRLPTTIWASGAVANRNRSSLQRFSGTGNTRIWLFIYLTTMNPSRSYSMFCSIKYANHFNILSFFTQICYIWCENALKGELLHFQSFNRKLPFNVKYLYFFTFLPDGFKQPLYCLQFKGI